MNSALTSYRKETDEGEELSLEGPEVALLMNLVATDTAVDEAKTLIPSLGRFPEAAIDESLPELPEAVKVLNESEAAMPFSIPEEN